MILQNGKPRSLPLSSKLSLALETTSTFPLRLEPALPPRHDPPHVRLEPPRGEPARRGLGLDDAPDGGPGEDPVGAPRGEDVVRLADAVDVAEGAVDLVVVVVGGGGRGGGGGELVWSGAGGEGGRG